jgi:hypothetical protein
MRTEIEKSNKDDNYVLILKERKERGKNKSIVGYNPITIHRHVSYHVEEDMMAHPRKQRKVKFGHRVMSHALPK